MLQAFRHGGLTSHVDNTFVYMKLRTLIVAAGMFAFAAPVFAQSDPPGTVMLKLSNRNTSERPFSPADFSDEAIVMTRENNLSSENGGWKFALFGSVRGLAYIRRIPESGWTNTIALKPETAASWAPPLNIYVLSTLWRLL